MRKFFVIKHPDGKVGPWYLPDDYDRDLVPEEIVIEISDSQEKALLDDLFERLNDGDENVYRDILSILDKYGHSAARQFMFCINKVGEFEKLVGDRYDNAGFEEDAIRYYIKSANLGDKCGKCKLGQYYAEGKACKQDRRKAKQMLKEAAQECQKVQKYLDQYGLR